MARTTEIAVPRDAREVKPAPADIGLQAAYARAYNIGQIVFRPMRGLTSRQKFCEETGQKFRIITALQRRDENGEIYDLTRIFFDELVKHPFSTHDDLIDAASRIYDLDPQPPVAHEAEAMESVEIESEDWTEE